MRAIVGLVVLGCSTASTPNQTVADYADAVSARDAARVWALSDSAYRDANDVEALRAWLQEHPEDAARLAAGLRQQGTTSAFVDSRAGKVQLTYEDGQWRIAAGGVVTGGPPSPQAALRAFFRAVDEGEHDGVRRVMPKDALETLPDEASLKAHLEALAPRIEAARIALDAGGPPEVEGSRARIPYGAGKAVELLLEDGQWKLLDLE